MPKKAKQLAISKSVSETSRANAKPMFRKGTPLGAVWGFIMWLVGVLVSLAVGFGMADGTLRIPFIPDVVAVTAGWIVILLAILGVLLKIIDRAGK